MTDWRLGEPDGAWPDPTEVPPRPKSSPCVRAVSIVEDEIDPVLLTKQYHDAYNNQNARDRNVRLPPPMTLWGGAAATRTTYVPYTQSSEVIRPHGAQPASAGPPPQAETATPDDSLNGSPPPQVRPTAAVPSEARAPIAMQEEGAPEEYDYRHPGMTHQPYQLHPTTPEMLPRNLLQSPSLSPSIQPISLPPPIHVTTATGRHTSPQPMIPPRVGGQALGVQQHNAPQIVQQVGVKQPPLLDPSVLQQPMTSVMVGSNVVFPGTLNPYPHPQAVAHPAIGASQPSLVPYGFPQHVSNPYLNTDGTLASARGRNNARQMPMRGGRGVAERGGGGHSNVSVTPTLPRSALLMDFHERPHDQWHLSNLRGHIVEFSRDQDGSRLIQRLLDNEESAELVFSEVCDIGTDVVSLMTDVFGNYVIQKLFEAGTPDHRVALVQAMRGQVLRLSLQTYGCRVVQKALDQIPSDLRLLIAGELEGHVPECVRDQNGNHVIQKVIESLPDQSQFIIRSFAGRITEMSTHAYGCRVLQRILERCKTPNDTDCIIVEVLQHIDELVTDQYGNYVVQHVLINSSRDFQARVIQHLTTRLYELSRGKFASNVAEKLVIYSLEHERSALLTQVMREVAEPDQSSALVAMMQDQYANYVVQKLLDLSTAEQRTAMVEHIKPWISKIGRCTFGRHILARFEKMGLLPVGSVDHQGSDVEDNVPAVPPHHAMPHHPTHAGGSGAGPATGASGGRGGVPASHRGAYMGTGNERPRGSGMRGNNNRRPN